MNMKYQIEYDGFTGTVDAHNYKSAVIQFQWYVDKWGTAVVSKATIDAASFGILEVKEID